MFWRDLGYRLLDCLRVVGKFIGWVFASVLVVAFFLYAAFVYFAH